MSKDNRNIVRAPRIHGRMVTDEDEIEQLLSPSQGEKLLESGALTGDWEFDGDDEEPQTEKPSELKELRDALEESAKARNSISLQNTTLFDANMALNNQVKDLQIENETLKSSVELNRSNFDKLGAIHDDNVRELEKVKAENEKLKADAEKSKAVKAPAK